MQDGICFGCWAKLFPNNFGSKTKAQAAVAVEKKIDGKTESERRARENKKNGENGKWKFVFLSLQPKTKKKEKKKAKKPNRTGRVTVVAL